VVRLHDGHLQEGLKVKLATVILGIYSTKFRIFLKKNFFKLKKNMAKMVLLEAHWRHTPRKCVQTILTRPVNATKKFLTINYALGSRSVYFKKKNISAVIRFLV